MSLATSILETVERKVLEEQRLTFEEGLALLNSEDPQDIEAIGALANTVRKKKVQDGVIYASTLFLYPTNLCELNCQFCSFYAKPGWKTAWFSTPAQIEEKIRAKLQSELNEVHIVGGLWRDCNLDYYEELFARIKALDPNLHIKALTPVEYHFLSEIHGITIEEVFQKMMRWGLGSLPGGGAEILVEEVRKKIAPGKISSETFLAIHELAHRLGLSSNITMLFGHIETHDEIITHLCRVREQQDRSHGFKTFIPLKFCTENNALGKRRGRLNEKNIPLLYAVCRLMLDNIPNLKVLWNYVGLDLALKILDWGANDLSSTNSEEKVIAMAGGPALPMDKAMMENLIVQRGRTPLFQHSGQ